MTNPHQPPPAEPNWAYQPPPITPGAPQPGPSGQMYTPPPVAQGHWPVPQPPPPQRQQPQYYAPQPTYPPPQQQPMPGYMHTQTKSSLPTWMIIFYALGGLPTCGILWIVGLIHWWVVQSKSSANTTIHPPR